jgi:hypothetical protein
VRPLAIPLLAFNTRWRWAPYGPGLKVAKTGHLDGRHGRIDARMLKIALCEALLRATRATFA